MDKKLKILQIATPVLPISPSMKYGGVERVVRDLDIEYVRRGHDSLVISSKNSLVAGRLIPSLLENTWQHSKGSVEYETDPAKVKQSFENHCLRCVKVILEENPDAVHDHTKFVTSDAYKNSNLSIPILTTLHGDLDSRGIEAIKKISKVRKEGINYFNAISESQRAIFSEAMPMDFTVLNAIDVPNYPFQQEKRNYFFSIGKMDKNKGQDICIDVAKSLNEKLVIAGPVHSFRSWLKKYWEDKIKPNIDSFYENIPAEQIDKFTRNFEKSNQQIIYVGEVNDKQKQEWFKYAKGFLMPIRWNEPFGLVMVESMACGTPVIAYDEGAVSEVITHGKVGYIAKPNDLGNFLYYTKKVGDINQSNCRNHVIERFNIKRQAEDYLRIFSKISKKN